MQTKNWFFPDPAPDHAIFIIDSQGANKKTGFFPLSFTADYFLKDKKATKKS
jgi:hypothetical protein